MTRIFGALGVLIMAGPPVQQAAPAVVGLYSIDIYHGKCAKGDDPACTPMLTGKLVLGANEIPSDVVEDLGFYAYPHKSIEGPPNGCFSLLRLRDSLGALLDRPQFEKEFINWLPLQPARVQFSLFRTPDAGYRVTLALSGEGGIGEAAGWGIGYVETLTDEVVVRRISTTDEGLCRDLRRLSAR